METKIDKIEKLVGHYDFLCESVTDSMIRLSMHYSKWVKKGELNKDKQAAYNLAMNYHHEKKAKLLEQLMFHQKTLNRAINKELTKRKESLKKNIKMMTPVVKEEEKEEEFKEKK